MGNFAEEVNIKFWLENKQELDFFFFKWWRKVSKTAIQEEKKTTSESIWLEGVLSLIL